MLVTIGFKPSVVSGRWFLRLFSMLSHKQKKAVPVGTAFFQSVRRLLSETVFAVSVFVGTLYLFEAVMDAVEFVNCHYSGGKSGGLKHDFCYAKHDMHAAVASDSFHSCGYFGYGFGMFLLAKNM